MEPMKHTGRSGDILGATLGNLLPRVRLNLDSCSLLTNQGRVPTIVGAEALDIEVEAPSAMAV
jgi:hypothetical protein